MGAGVTRLLRDPHKTRLLDVRVPMHLPAAAQSRCALLLRSYAEANQEGGVPRQPESAACNARLSVATDALGPSLGPARTRLPERYRRKHQ